MHTLRLGIGPRRRLQLGDSEGGFGAIPRNAHIRRLTKMVGSVDVHSSATERMAQLSNGLLGMRAAREFVAEQARGGTRHAG